MDSKKILILILVVVAVLTVMFIGVGFRSNRGDRDSYQQKEKDGPFSGVDGIFARFRKPFDTSRVNRATTTCTWKPADMVVEIPGSCRIEINEGKSASSGFKLTPAAGIIQACYGFDETHLEDCMSDEDERSNMKPNARFVVGKDKAILQLYCATAPQGGGPCLVRVILEK